MCGRSRALTEYPWEEGVEEGVECRMATQRERETGRGEAEEEAVAVAAVAAVGEKTY